MGIQLWGGSYSGEVSILRNPKTYFASRFKCSFRKWWMKKTIYIAKSKTIMRVNNRLHQSQLIRIKFYLEASIFNVQLTYKQIMYRQFQNIIIYKIRIRFSIKIWSGLKVTYHWFCLFNNFIPSYLLIHTHKQTNTKKQHALKILIGFFSSWYSFLYSVSKIVCSLFGNRLYIISNKTNIV
jgi:hypothetical protein